MSLSEVLKKELQSYRSLEPKVLMYVDESSIYWVTKEGYYVWIQDHTGIDEYRDSKHKEESLRYTDKKVDGVNNTGVYWNNKDFEYPFVKSDFLNRIENINI